jgi:hypothetical protein
VTGLPALLPGECLSCGLTSRPVVHDRCDLCSAIHGPASAPEHVSTILPRVLADLRARRAPA